MSGEIEAAQKELNDRVLGRDGISGTAIGLDGDVAVLKVYVRDAEAGRSVPKRIAGFRVVVEETGEFRRL